MARLDTVSPVTTGGHYNNQLDAAGARSKWWSRQAVEGKLPLTLTLTEPQTLTLCEPCVTRTALGMAAKKAAKKAAAEQAEAKQKTKKMKARAQSRFK